MVNSSSLYPPQNRCVGVRQFLHTLINDTKYTVYSSIVRVTKVSGLLCKIWLEFAVCTHSSRAPSWRPQVPSRGGGMMWMSATPTLALKKGHGLMARIAVGEECFQMPLGRSGMKNVTNLKASAGAPARKSAASAPLFARSRAAARPVSSPEQA